MTDEFELARLTSVNPREVWRDEALHLTPWLLQSADVLAELLGIDDLVLEAAEHRVGDFRLDLIGYDQATGHKIIIENQLGRSDHHHLGQLITYAAGTDAKTIVWLTTEFREEHRSALEWLNHCTDEDTRFFGVQIHVVRIGDSPAAPNFELAVKPNDWEKTVKKAATSTRESGAALTYREFWTTVLERIRDQRPGWTNATGSSSNWQPIGTGISHVQLHMSWSQGVLTHQVYFASTDAQINERRFRLLEKHRDLVESLVGTKIVWDSMPGRKGTRIIITSPFDDIDARDRWTEMADWLIDIQERLREALTHVDLR
ncbi:DUF4268 domain-containing protein [Rhodococcus pyridinivorans]|uniref:DUF4268 domain-containing protein n=1 Tax=Rhodococcus pyridinivorans TaxID=103816 RepID=UPI00344519C8